MRKVLAFDLGGTKLAAAIVTEKGKILNECRERVDFSAGFKSLSAQIIRIGRDLGREHGNLATAIASAGPLDPESGILLNPTNFLTDGKHWGVVPLTRGLSKAFGQSVMLENDAAAATLAEAWVGQARRVKDFVVVTLGTGVGVGVFANGALLRSGRQLHTEGGHLLLHPEDRALACGCGNYGCAEAFLSGTNFTKRLAKLWSEPKLSGEELVHRARAGDERAISAFVGYGRDLGSFLYSLAVLFSPRLIVLSGGFSHSADLFLPEAERCLAGLMATRREGVDLLPTIKLSKFRDEAGLLGAAYVAINHKSR